MNELTILSNNVFWFQGVPFASDQPGEPDSSTLRNLGDFYKQINPDLLCLQEIQNQSAFDDIAAYLETEGCYCSGKTLSQYGGAVLWQSNRSRELINSSLFPQTQRVWQIVETIKNQTHIRVANVHLPSPRQLGGSAAQKQRVAELQDVLDAGAAPPEVIVGDLNEQPGGTVTEFLQNNGYIDAAKLTQQAHLPTNIKGNRRGDYIWLHVSIQNQLLAYHVLEKENFIHPNADKDYLSDHLPLWVTLAC